MLEKFQPAKADPILGLGKLYQADPRDGKIDLGVGVYKDASGNTDRSGSERAQRPRR